MGFNSSAMTKILLGVGFGILMIFGLIATACFGKYANWYTKFQKIEFKLELDLRSKAIDISIAIAVLGCISAVAAIAGIALSILMDGQTLILIIVGGVSALFAFGCIVAEGVFINTCENYMLDTKNNKGAQKHIKKSIKELYETGWKALKKYNDGVEILTWSEVEKNFLGKVKENSDGEKVLYTYKDIWGDNYRSDSNSPNFVILQKSYGYITASCDGCNEAIKIASTRFIYNGTYTPKERFCWLNDKKTNFKCKNVKKDKTDDYITTEYYRNELTIGQTIVVGDYISPTKENELDLNNNVDYYVDSFPVFYHMFNPDEIENFKKINLYESGHYFEEDTNHFKVKAKNYLKAEFDDENKDKTNPSDLYFTFVPKNDVHFCDKNDGNGDDEEYRKAKLLDTEDGEYGLNYCNGYFTYQIGYIFQQNYKDANKGKINSFWKKQTKKAYLPSIKDIWNYETYADTPYDDPLPTFTNYYNVALMCMIVQIFGIIFWACGRFLGLLLGGGSDAKTPSDGEA